MARTRVLFYRKDLFKVTPYGLMADQIGPLWCSGWVPTERLSLLRKNNIWFDEKNV